MKTITIYWEIAIWLVCIPVSGKGETMRLSLTQTCKMGIEKNSSVQNAMLEQQKTLYQFRETVSRLYPQIEGYSSFNYYYAIPKMILPGEIFGQSGPIPVELGTTYDWSSGFKASQVLYNQSLFTSLKIAHHLDAISSLSLRQKKEEIVYQVAQVYYLCQATEKQIVELEKSVNNAEKLLEIAKLQNENGSIRNVDYSRVMVTKNNLQIQLDNIVQLCESQQGLLKFLIGVGLNVPIALSDSFSHVPENRSFEPPDVMKNTECRLLTMQKSVARLKVKLHRQSYLPSLAVFGQHCYQGQRDKFDFFEEGDEKFFKTGLVGINFILPLFDGFEKHSKVRQSEIELEQLQNTLTNTSAYFSKEFADAERRYVNGMNTFRRQQENCKAAAEAYDISLLGYREQVVSLSDLLMSENSLAEARLSTITILLQLKNADLDLKKAEGDLLTFR